MTLLDSGFWNSAGAVALIGAIATIATQIIAAWRNGKKVDALSTKTDVQTDVLAGKADQHEAELGKVAVVVNGQQKALRDEIAVLKAELLTRPPAPPASEC